MVSIFPEALPRLLFRNLREKVFRCFTGTLNKGLLFCNLYPLNKCIFLQVVLKQKLNDLFSPSLFDKFYSTMFSFHIVSPNYRFKLRINLDPIV